jgi:hypothetical protein
MALLRGIGRGLAAGAVGTTALNAVTYLDLVIRARPASEMPGKAADLLADRAGRPIPGNGAERANRREGLGALLGIATGLGIGVGVGLLGPVLVRVPRPLAGTLVGAAAMAASDVPMVSMGLTDPKSWSRADWVSDAIPHVVYGMSAMAALRAMHGRRRGIGRGLAPSASG